MLERFFLHEEKTHHYFTIIIISFVITFIVGIINSFIGGNSLFLVALVSLVLAYPIVNYLRNQTKKQYLKKFSWRRIIENYENELVLFWSVFIGVTIGFYMNIPLLDDLSAQSNFVTQLKGNITETSLGFSQILLNNLGVGFFTFLLSIISFSTLIFVLTWNASILAYYLYSIGSTQTSIIMALLILPHGLLEVVGYVLMGTAGALLAYNFDYNLKKKKINISKQIIEDIIVLLIIGIIFIVIGAFLETL